MENGVVLQVRREEEGASEPMHHGLKKKNDGQPTHRRTISGSLLGLGGLSFLGGSTSKDASTVSGDNSNSGGGKRGSSSRAGVLRQSQSQSQGRKRKGSLRKSIMGKNMMRERRNSRVAARPPAINTQMMGSDSPQDELSTPRPFTYEHAALNSSSDSGSTPASRSTSTASSFSRDGPEYPAPRLPASPITSPAGPYASTTDDDESLSFFHPSASSGSSAYNVAGLPSQGSAMLLQRRRSNRSGQHSSLTIVHTPADFALDDEWDYSETEWWGWVVLVVTWIVFVVVMGSCLEVWSWAWDVGETPYAPPELEDDPTLPITGYYPALMVCTAVMAWVWVVVAWVGMKYFRHAKVVGDDG